MDKIKVLMADDETEILDIMANKVSHEGYDVIKAYDGQEAWDKICESDPDVVLLDLSMPHMDGLEVLENLRKSPPSKKWIPVIIISARSELEDMRAGYSLEADHYISKPCNIDDVLKALTLMVNLIPRHDKNQD